MRYALRTLLTSLATLLLMPTAGALAAATAKSSTPSFYFDSTSVTAHNGDTFSLGLHVNPNGGSFNTVNVTVAFPSNQLTFAGLDKTGSAFTTIIPTTPTATDSGLTFAAATLGNGPITSDSLVANLKFTAKVASGYGNIKLDGSQVASNGNATDANTTPTSVSFAASDGGGAATPITISGITTSHITMSGATVSWHTSVPTTGSVDYGTTKAYGFTAADTTLGTDHSVNLGKLFPGKAVVHYKITAQDAQSNAQSSADQTVTTLGYTIQIHVVNKKHHNVSGAYVSVNGANAVRSNSTGIVTVTDVAPGGQKVVIDGGAPQLVSVDAATGDQASTIQQFTLTAVSKTSVLTFVALGVLLVILIGILAALETAKRTRHGFIDTPKQ